MGDITVIAVVRGRVQGVGFRHWTERQARSLGLSGWVRNEPDGTVTALVSGPDLVVETMIDKLHEGPRDARVASVLVRHGDPTDAPVGFTQLR